MKPISQRAYARHRGCALNAVQEAIAARRLSKSLVKVGKTWKIRDVEAADAEWTANTKSDRIPLTGPAASEAPPDYSESRARREAAEAGLAELELEEAMGKVVKAGDVASRLEQVFAHCKRRLQAVPSRLRQQDVPVEHVDLVEGLIREALEELADGGWPAKGRGKQRASAAGAR